MFINGLLKQLPPVEGPDNDLPPLANVFVVATVARMAEIGTILDKTAKRAYKHLGETLEQRGEQTGKPISGDDFRRRFFSYLVEDPEKRKGLDAAIGKYLSKEHPQVLHQQLDKVIVGLQQAAKGFYSRWIKELAQTLENREQSKAHLALLEQVDPKRRERLHDRRTRIVRMIETAKDSTRNYIQGSLKPLLTAEAIEAMIMRRYDDKKEAKELALPYLIDHVQNKLNQTMAKHSEHLATEIDDLLTEYDAGNVTQDVRNSEVDIPFNAKGAFMGALAGIGTVGGLGAWAAAAAAGSNLGGYILVSQVVGWLSSIGIGVGGTSTAVSVVAALGGPVTIAIGIAALIGFGIFALFGGSWQKRLAKKIAKTVKEQELITTLTNSADKFWDDTLSGFNKATDETEKSYRENIKKLRNIVESTDYAHIRTLLGELEALRDFFAGIVWKRAS
jgi:hypothetical protein